MQISMQEYIKTIPLVKGRAGRDLGELPGGVSTTSTSTAPTTASSEATSTSTSGGPTTASSGSTTTSTSGGLPFGNDAGSTLGSSTGMLQGLVTDEGVIQFMHDKVVGADLEPELTSDEKKLIGSVVGQLNWAARQGRYDLAFGASLIQQLSGQGKAEALKWVNTVVRRVREEVEVVIRKFDCDLQDLLVVSVSDAAYGAMPAGASQGGTMVMFAEPAVLQGTGAVCIMEANSTKSNELFVARCQRR